MSTDDSSRRAASATAEFDQLSERGDRELRRLSSVVLEGRKPPPGPYAFFHHSGHSIQKLSDVRQITKRLVDGRRDLTELIAVEEELRPAPWPAGTPFPREVSDAMTRTGEQVALMRIDLESLYLFGQLLLDPWSLQALLVAGPGLRRDHAFTSLVVALEDGAAPDLAPLWDAHSAELLWLFWQLRFYRNRFIAHVDRPWQRGCTYGHWTDDFQLHIPSPPGWLDGSEKAEEVRSAFAKLPRGAFERKPDPAKTSPAQLLEFMFNRIGQIPDRTLRREIGSLYGDLGGSTPSFQIVGRNLLSFIADATPTLTEIALHRLDEIEL